MTADHAPGSRSSRSVVTRGLSLLDAFDRTDEPTDEPTGGRTGSNGSVRTERADGAELTLAQLAARTGLPKATVHRLLGQLVDWGGIERTATGYRLGHRLFELGQLVPRHRALRESARPYMQDLHQATHENVHLAILDGAEVIVVEKVCGRRSMPIRSCAGTRLPAYCTAIGKVLLAQHPPTHLRQVVNAGLVRRTPRTIVAPGLLRQELARTLERGYGVSREEFEIGLSSVAAPIFDRSRGVVAALAVCGRVHGLDLDRIAPTVGKAARELARDLAYRLATSP